MNDESAALPERQLLAGEAEYGLAIERVLKSAQRDLQIFDIDFQKGAWSSKSRAELIYAFLSEHRDNKLMIVLHDTDFLTNYCPRIMKLLETYSHKMTIRKTDAQVHHARDPIIIADSQHHVHRLHIDHDRFVIVMNDALTTKALQERFEQLLDAASEQIASTNLGL